MEPIQVGPVLAFFTGIGAFVACMLLAFISSQVGVEPMPLQAWMVVSGLICLPVMAWAYEWHEKQEIRATHYDDLAWLRGAHEELTDQIDRLRKQERVTVAQYNEILTLKDRLDLQKSRREVLG